MPLPIRYKDVEIDNAYRLDVVVEGKIVLEVKSVEALTAVHLAQLMTYLKLANLRTGLLLNFNVKILRDGIKRIVA